MSDVTPRHVGIIIDGNRRWAKQHGLPGYEGHLAGHNTLTEVLPELMHAGVTYASLYVFSTENWKRSEDEVSRLMALILNILTNDLKMFHENQVRLQVLGRQDGLSDKVLAAIERAESETQHHTRGTVALCFNYGGQQEIVDATRQIIEAGVAADDVTPELVAHYLYAPDIPPVDLIVRTSGEQRLSNFMLWRAAYSELLFLDKPWPDMTKDDIHAILDEYSKRQRRFGG